MSETPLSRARTLLRGRGKYMSAGTAGRQDDFSEMQKTLSNNFVLHQSPDLPFGGEYRGHEGYERWAVQMSTTFDLLEVSERLFFEQDDTVVAVCRFRTRSRRTGQTQDYPMVQVVQTRDGQITKWNVPAYVGAIWEY